MDSQQEAKEEFRDALEQFEVCGRRAGFGAAAVYDRLNNAFEDAESQAEEVSDRIERGRGRGRGPVRRMARRARSDQQPLIAFSECRAIAQRPVELQCRLIKAMRRAESRMEPVLTTFRDHVLFLKHNLNAQAISALRGELGGIEADVGRLIRDMEASIAQAQSFIQSLDNA